jgi:hypothetical protein
MDGMRRYAYTIWLTLLVLGLAVAGRMDMDAAIALLDWKDRECIRKRNTRLGFKYSETVNPSRLASRVTALSLIMRHSVGYSAIRANQ